MTLELMSPATEAAILPNQRGSRPQNLLDVKTIVRALPLRPSEKSNLISALNTIARGTLPITKKGPNEEELDAALARISVHARYLMPLLDRRVGARLGLTRPAWRNASWRLKRALKLAGCWELFKNERIALAPEWQAVARRIPSPSHIRLLGYWGTLANVMPGQFTEAHLPLFLDWLQSWKFRTYALKCYFAALGEWNKSAHREPDWPGRPVVVETRLSGHYSVPPEKWQPGLIAELERILKRMQRPDPDEDEAYEPITAQSAKCYRERILRTLSAYVAAKSIDPSTITTVAVLVVPENAKAALDYMLEWIQRKKPEKKRTSDVHGSAKLISTLAERIYRGTVTGDTILKLQKMARARAPKRKGMTLKNRDLLRQFDDEYVLARFLALPYDVAARVLKRENLRRIDAVKLMLALAVGQSIEAPLRPEDQAALIDGEHVFKVRNGRSEVLAIRTVARKTGIDLDFELSGAIVDLYDSYTQVARKLLCSAENRHLYPGVSGPKFRGSLSPQITRFVEDELGIRLTGQQFRHLIGYVYLKAHPGDYETVRQLLGHKDITTTMAFYAAMDMRAASKKVSAFVAEKRDELAPLLRRRRATEAH